MSRILSSVPPSPHSGALLLSVAADSKYVRVSVYHSLSDDEPEIQYFATIDEALALVRNWLSEAGLPATPPAPTEIL